MFVAILQEPAIQLGATRLLRQSSDLSRYNEDLDGACPLASNAASPDQTEDAFEEDAPDSCPE